MAEDSKFSYGEVHTYLNSGEYPPDCDKRSLRRKAANFTVEEGSLGSIVLETRRTRIEVGSNNIKLNNYLITDLIRVSRESEIQRVCNACVGDDILRCRTQFNGESRPAGQYSMATYVPPDVAR